MTDATAAPRTGLTAPLYRLKDWVESLAERRHAGTSLFALAAVESFIFPIPPDVLLMALCIGRPKQAFRFAAICTAGSVLGAFVGYAIGFFLWYDVAGVAPGADPAYSGLAQFFFDHVPGFTPEGFEQIAATYREYGFWAIFTAGFTPIPYKLFTVTAGIAQLNLAGFALASLVSRAGRFFLVAALFYFFGVPIKRFIDRYLGWLTLLFTALLVGGFLLLKVVV